MKNCMYEIHNGPVEIRIQGKFDWPNPFHLCEKTLIQVVNEEDRVIQILFHPHYKNLVGRVGKVESKYLTSAYIKEVKDTEDGLPKVEGFVPKKGCLYHFDGKGTAYDKYRLNNTILRCLNVRFDVAGMLLWGKFEILNPEKQGRVARLNRDKIFWAVHALMRN